MTVSHDLSLLNERPQGSSLALFSPSVDEGVISSDETSDENDPLEALSVASIYSKLLDDTFLGGCLIWIDLCEHSS